MIRPSLPYSLQNVEPERVTSLARLARLEALCSRIRILVHARQRGVR